PLKVSSVTIYASQTNQLVEVAGLKDLDISCYFTESRMAFVCTKFATGSTYFPFTGAGIAIAVAATVASKMRAAATARGKAIIGHLRYAWLVGIMHGSGEATLRFGYHAPNLHFADLCFDAAQVDAGALARDVARLIATYRLADIAPRGSDDIHALR